MRRTCTAVLAFERLAASAREADRPWTTIHGRHVTIVGQQSAKTRREMAELLPRGYVP